MATMGIKGINVTFKKKSNLKTKKKPNKKKHWSEGKKDLMREQCVSQVSTVPKRGLNRVTSGLLAERDKLLHLS